MPSLRRNAVNSTLCMRVPCAELDCAKVTVLYVTIRLILNYACHVCLLLSLLQLVFVSMMYIIVYKKCYDTLLQMFNLT